MVKAYGNRIDYDSEILESPLEDEEQSNDSFSDQPSLMDF